jgi:hypothetical protein
MWIKNVSKIFIWFSWIGIILLNWTFWAYFNIYRSLSVEYQLYNNAWFYLYCGLRISYVVCERLCQSSFIIKFRINYRDVRMMRWARSHIRIRKLIKIIKCGASARPSDMSLWNRINTPHIGRRIIKHLMMMMILLKFTSLTRSGWWKAVITTTRIRLKKQRNKLQESRSSLSA